MHYPTYLLSYQGLLEFIWTQVYSGNSAYQGLALAILGLFSAWYFLIKRVFKKFQF